MTYDLCGLGTLAADVLMTVDQLPGSDSFSMVQHVESQPGGSGTNIVVQAARLGSRTAYIGTIGDDGPGATVRASLAAEGVDTSCLYTRPGEITTHTEIVVDQHGEKFILLIMGDAFFKLRLSQKERDLIHQAKVFFTDLLPGWAALSAVKEAYCGDRRIAVSIQIGIPLYEEMGVTREQILETLRYAHLLVPCKDAARQLSGSDDPVEQGRFFREHSPESLIVLTEGSKGSRAFLPDGRVIETPAFPVHAVDTTGAGDSFMGALIEAYLVKEQPVEKALRFASHCAALTCTGLGARFRPEGGYPALD